MTLLKETFKKLTFAVCAAFFSLTLSSIAMGQVVAGWDTSALTSYGPSPFAPTTTGANVTVVGLTRGSGVTTTQTAAARAWGGNGWDNGTATASTAAQNIAANKFFTFSVKSNTGFALSLSSINPFDYRRSGTGPSNGLIQYQINSGSFVDVATVAFSSSANAGASVGSTDLSGISALQNLPSSSTVTFRVVPYGATAATGAFYVYDVVNSTANDLAINGTVTAVVVAPTTQASNITFSGTTQTQTAASWTNGNGAGRVVYVNTANTFTNPTNGTSPTANTVYGGSGQQAVFNGTGNTVTVTGLTAGTTYYFRVYEYNGSGTTTVYQTATATGNPNSVTTTAANVAPTITANPTTQTITAGSTGISSITITDENPTTVTLSGTSNNQTLVPNSGISFTTTGNPRTLTVTPAAGQTGTATITITATDAGGLTGTTSYILTVNAPTITIAPTTLPNGITGVNYSQTITATGGTSPYNYTINAGALPDGITLTSGGTLGGIPMTAGTYNFTIRATDTNGFFGSRTYTLVINSAPAFTSANSTTFTVGTAGSFNITTSGSPTVTTITSSGILPTGVIFTDNGNGTATLSGTPATGTDGTYTLSFTASNGILPDATQTFTLTVNPAPAPGTLSFSSPTYSVSEGTATATITVTRTGGTDGEVSATYATATTGTATAGACGASASDYVATSGTVTFPAGSSASQTFTVTICDNTIYENAETVNLTLSNATGGASIGTGAATLTINDNDPIPTFTISDLVKNEGDSGTTSFTFTVTKTNATDLPATVDYATADGTATSPSDYTAIPLTTLTFAPNVADLPVTVFVNGDMAPEANETFFVNLSNATGATISDAQGMGTITNDEAAIATLDAPNCTGLASSPLTGGSTNRAVLCFALSSNSNANFTDLNVPFTNNGATRFTNPRLISSTDADFTTTGDNVTVTTGTATTTRFEFRNFAAFAEARDGNFPSLTNTPTNFFVVADVISGVSASTPGTQPSVSTGDITVSNGTVNGTTATGQNYTFTAIATAADGVISGRVTNTRHRGLEGVTVTLSGGSLVEPIMVYTDQRGRYNFTEVPTGAIYTITVNSKRHTFNQPSTALNLTGNSENVNFVGEGW